MSIHRRRDGKWRARHRGPDGKERARHFARKVDAERWLAAQTVAKHRGEWVDPALSGVTLGEWAQRWYDAQVHLKPSTHETYGVLLRRHVLVRWGRVPLAKVGHADVVAWVAGLRASGLSASRTRAAHRVLSRVLDLAVRDGRLPKNPAAKVDLPRLPRAGRRYLNHDQLRQLAEACGRYQVLVLVFGYTGLRWGEAVALRVRSVDLLRGRLEVVESVTEVGGKPVFGTPKAHATRTVPIPRFLRLEIDKLIVGKASDELVFTAPEGGLLRSNNFRRRCFDRAAASVGLEGLVPHELRHTAASLAVSSGASVKVVQRMLGHASAAMTLDVYTDLFDDDLDAVADRLDQAAARADRMRTEAGIVDLSRGRASS